MIVASECPRYATTAGIATDAMLPEFEARRLCRIFALLQETLSAAGRAYRQVKGKNAKQARLPRWIVRNGRNPLHKKRRKRKEKQSGKKTRRSLGVD